MQGKKRKRKRPPGRECGHNTHPGEGLRGRQSLAGYGRLHWLEMAYFWTFLSESPLYGTLGETTISTYIYTRNHVRKYIHRTVLRNSFRIAWLAGGGQCGEVNDLWITRNDDFTKRLRGVEGHNSGGLQRGGRGLAGWRRDSTRL